MLGTFVTIRWCKYFCKSSVSEKRRIWTCECVCVHDLYIQYLWVHYTLTHSTMKQPSYVTVCGTLIKKLFFFCVLKMEGGKWAGVMNWELLYLSARIICHHPRVCLLFFAWKWRSITAFFVTYLYYHSTRTDINMFLICEDSHSTFQRACFHYYFSEEYWKLKVTSCVTVFQVISFKLLSWCVSNFLKTCWMSQYSHQSLIQLWWLTALDSTHNR